MSSLCLQNPNMYQFKKGNSVDNCKIEDSVKITQNLFNQLSSVDEMKEIIIKCREFPDHAMLVSMMGSDDLTVFRLLFKYELFNFMHKCIVEYLTTGKISSDSLANITKNL